MCRCVSGWQQHPPELSIRALRGQQQGQQAGAYCLQPASQGDGRGLVIGESAGGALSLWVVCVGMERAEVSSFAWRDNLVRGRLSICLGICWDRPQIYANPVASCLVPDSSGLLVAVVTHAKMSVRTMGRSGLRYVLVPVERQPAGIDLTCRSLHGTEPS